MSEVRLSNNLPSIESLQRRFEALKKDSEEVKGVVVKGQVEGKIPEITDLWFKVVQFKPEPLSLPYLYGVAYTLIRLQDLEGQLDLYEAKEPSNRIKLGIPLKILRAVAEGRTKKDELMVILHTTLHPTSPLKKKKEIPNDWPLRQLETQQRKKDESIEPRSLWASLVNSLSRLWSGGSASQHPFEHNWVKVFPELNNT